MQKVKVVTNLWCFFFHFQEYEEALKKFRNAYFWNTTNADAVHRTNDNLLSDSGFNYAIVKAFALQSEANQKIANDIERKKTFLFRWITIIHCFKYQLSSKSPKSHFFQINIALLIIIIILAKNCVWIWTLYFIFWIIPRFIHRFNVTADLNLKRIITNTKPSDAQHSDDICYIFQWVTPLKLLQFAKILIS